MNTLKFTFLLLLSVVLFSCSENDPVPAKTEGELLGEELKELTQNQFILKATTYMMFSWGTSGVDLSIDEYEGYFTIESQIIKVNDTYYNLSKLIKFEIRQNANEEDILYLYFEGFQN